MAPKTIISVRTSYRISVKNVYWHFLSHINWHMSTDISYRAFIVTYGAACRGGSVVSPMPCVRMVAGSNPTLAPREDLGQVLHLQSPVALRRVNSSTISVL